MTNVTETTPKGESKQSDRFEVIARRLECDESEAVFATKLGKIARAKPAPVKACPKE
jgi:hypothetical protein